MIRISIRYRKSHKSKNDEIAIKNSINEMLKRNCIVISKAKTINEVGNRENYNYSVMACKRIK